MRILIAGVGNIFLGDDGFGVEVAQRLLQREMPPGVHVVDFGIRNFDLVYALLDGYDVTIFVDAVSRGGEPGTVYTIQPDMDEIDALPVQMEAHGMNPMAVLKMARSMGGQLGNTLIVGCEPETLGPEEGQLGLSACVAAAVERTVVIVESLAATLLARQSAGIDADAMECLQKETI